MVTNAFATTGADPSCTTTTVAFVRVCDMHDLAEWWVEVEATRTFGHDGETYEIDLCGEHDAALTEVLQPYVDAGRRIIRRRV